MSFNISLAVQVAGPSAPLAFAIGTTVVFVVGLSFVAWSRRVAHVGSAYGYIAQTFGKSWGFLTGWALLLTYLTYGAGTAAMVGNFVEAAAHTLGWHTSALSVTASALGILLATFLACRDTRLAGRTMLLLEGLSILAVAILAFLILHKLGAQHRLTLQPFKPSPAYHGWSGVGYAIVFAVLSFGGFEAAATLGEETANPHRAIPIAILGTLLLAGTLYVIASYVQVSGFGIQHADALAHDPAPFDTLALHYASRGYAVVLDLAAALGAFSCVLGSLSAAGRMLYALTRAGLGHGSSSSRTKRNGLAEAITLTGAASVLCLLLWEPRVGAGDYYGSMGTIGTLALILVYMGVAAAQARIALTHRQIGGVLLGCGGVLLLIWPLYNSVYPVPAYPGDLWPILLLGWLCCGGLLLLLRPRLARKNLPEILQAEE